MLSSSRARAPDDVVVVACGGAPHDVVVVACGGAPDDVVVIASPGAPDDVVRRRQRPRHRCAGSGMHGTPGDAERPRVALRQRDAAGHAVVPPDDAARTTGSIRSRSCRRAALTRGRRRKKLAMRTAPCALSRPAPCGERRLLAALLRGVLRGSPSPRSASASGFASSINATVAGHDRRRHARAAQAQVRLEWRLARAVQPEVGQQVVERAVRIGERLDADARARRGQAWRRSRSTSDHAS